MGDVDETKSEPEEAEAVTRKHWSVAYPLDSATNRLKEITSSYEKFEEMAKTMGYVSPRILREQRRRMKMMLIKESADLLVKTGQLVIHFLRS